MGISYWILALCGVMGVEAVTWHPVGDVQLTFSTAWTPFTRTSYPDAVTACQDVGGSIWVHDTALDSQVAPLMTMSISYWTLTPDGQSVCNEIRTDDVSTVAVSTSYCSNTLPFICQRDNCSPNPCLNGGACMDLGDQFTCACVGGYTGPTCATGPTIVELTLDGDCRSAGLDSQCVRVDSGSCDGCGMQSRTVTYNCNGDTIHCNEQCFEEVCPDLPAIRDMTLEEVIDDAVQASNGGDINSATMEVRAANPSFVSGKIVVILDINFTFSNDGITIGVMRCDRIWICCQPIPGTAVGGDVPCPALMQLMPCWLWRLSCPWWLWPAQCVH